MHSTRICQSTSVSYGDWSDVHTQNRHSLTYRCLCWIGVHKKLVACDSIEFDSKKNSVRNKSNQLGFETNKTQFVSKLVQIELELSLTRFETLRFSAKPCFNFKTSSVWNWFESHHIKLKLFSLKPCFNFEPVRFEIASNSNLNYVKFNSVRFITALMLKNRWLV